MSDSPFAAQADVSMTTGGEAGGEPQGQPGQQQRAPEANKPLAPEQRRAPPPQRGRLDDFAPHVRSNHIEVTEVAEDADDPFSAIVDRTVKGAKGQELARKAPPKNIHEEIEAVAELSAADAAAAQGLDQETEELEATLVEDDERLTSDPRYKRWVEAETRLSELEKADHLPEAYYSKFIPVELPDQRKTQVNIVELQRSYLRQSDYTHKLREMRDYERAIKQREAGVQRLINQLGSGDANHFLQFIEFAGAMKGFQQAALMWGWNLEQEERMSPDERQVRQTNRQLHQELMRARIEADSLRNQAAQAQQQQQPESPDAAYISHQLNQMLPLAAKRLEEEGRPFISSSLAEEILKRDWEVFCREHQGELSTASIMDVLRGVMEQVEVHIQSGYVPEPPPKAASQVPPVSRQAAPPTGQATARSAQLAGAPNYAQQSQNGKRARIGDLQNIHRR